MKHLLLLSIMFIAFAGLVSAQSFTIVNDLDETISGTTIVIPITVNGDVEPHFKVKNISGVQVSARISKTYVEGPVASAYNNMCSPTTALTPSAVCVTGTQTPVFIVSANETSGEVHITFEQGGDPGVSTIQYKVFNVDNVNDFAVVNLSFSTLTSVANENADLFAVYPNPATRNFTIQHNYGSQAVIEVFNVLGKSVAKVNSSSSNQTSIDCSKWENGYYFCRLYNNGRVEKTLKLVVTH